MAKKKKSRLNKKQQKQLKAILVPGVVGLIALIVGIFGTTLLSDQGAPKNIVWASENTVHVPGDLRAFLEKQEECKEYRGAGTPTGVGLWGIYQTHKDRYAKVAYGCSWNLNSYIMAVKQSGKWMLIPTKEYFAPFTNGANTSQGALPLCSQVEKYAIPAAIESFCIKADGAARANTL